MNMIQSFLTKSHTTVKQRSPLYSALFCTKFDKLTTNSVAAILPNTIHLSSHGQSMRTDTLCTDRKFPSMLNTKSSILAS